MQQDHASAHQVLSCLNYLVLIAWSGAWGGICQQKEGHLVAKDPNSSRGNSGDLNRTLCVLFLEEEAI